jgi:hypothetical protein
MAYLSHWDFAETFPAYDAAALILGLEPRDSEEEWRRINVILDRMNNDFERAKTRVISLSGQSGLDAGTELASVYLQALERELSGEGYDPLMEDETVLPSRIKLETQQFRRQVIVNWLKAIGMNSVYSFELGQSSSVATSAGPWPWGRHHTAALDHLEAAAKRFWVNYDPKDDTTAPINAVVSEWLQTERKLSKSLANSMATILRADGLPTGPRK